ncbi:MAG TPA: thiamine pyrophosphate-dependent enzyme [Polyangia bacterium]|jgi:2-oxoglutarate ferredoxin oxidoreductase subunit beta
MFRPPPANDAQVLPPRDVQVRPRAFTPRQTHYCPGCTHGVAHRVVAELLDEMSLRERAVGIAPVGCSVLAYEYYDCDFQEAAHGRAPAVATGVKRARPDAFVFAFQGDGDLASIGMAEIVHAANRGEKITIVFINNAIYGMTGGQMAPTTLVGQRTTTTPLGRDPALMGRPLRVAELLTTLETPSFIARGALHRPQHVLRAKELIRRAFSYQLAGACFALVELLSTCPTNWGVAPTEAPAWLEAHMLPTYPLGVFKTPDGPDRAPRPLGGPADAGGR